MKFRYWRNCQFSFCLWSLFVGLALVLIQLPAQTQIQTQAQVQTQTKTEFPKNSLYHLNSEWLTQDGKKTKLRDNAGKPVILGMIYTGCDHACPLTISQIQSIEDKIREKGIKDYLVVLASFDIKNDRPSHLKKYMAKRKLDSNHWSMLAADQDETVRELAIILGINYKKLGEKDYSHSNILTLLDKNGVPLEHLEGLNSDTKQFVEKFPRESGNN